MNTPDYFNIRVLQAAFCATSLLLMIPNAQAVDGYAKDASNGCAIFKPNLKAGETVTFKGPCANIFGEGRGVAKWSASDGTTVIFEGNFVQGKLQGNGKMIASGGDSYEGDYKDGKREGLGVYTSANGDRFNGQYKDNQRNGHGILTLATGSRTEGEWRNGNPVSVTSMSSSGAGSAGPKLVPPQPSAAAPQSSSTTGTSAEKIGVETVAVSGATLRAERCGRLPLALGVDPISSVVVVKIPKRIDLQKTTKSGTYYDSSKIGGDVYPILMEALDIVEKHCQLKDNPIAFRTDVYMYIDQLPSSGTKWPNNIGGNSQIDPKPSLIAAMQTRGRWRVENLVSDAYIKEQQAKQKEEQAKQLEQQRQVQLTAIAEAKKKESDRENARRNRIEAFFKKHNLVNKEAKGLYANPFAFEGDKLFLVVGFEQMQSATTGLFYLPNEGILVVNDIPKGAFIQKSKILLAAKVLGNVKFDGVIDGLLQVHGLVPNLKFLGALICRDDRCDQTDEK